jgi:hypothetical protein
MPTKAKKNADGAKHHWIARVRVKGGYVDGFDQRFDPLGNLVIDDHGPGKSTLLALIRFALALVVPAMRVEDFEMVLATNLGTGRVFVTVCTPADGELTFSRAITKKKQERRQRGGSLRAVARPSG